MPAFDGQTGQTFHVVAQFEKEWEEWKAAPDRGTTEPPSLERAIENALRDLPHDKSVHRQLLTSELDHRLSPESGIGYIATPWDKYTKMVQFSTGDLEFYLIWRRVRAARNELKSRWCSVDRGDSVPTIRDLLPNESSLHAPWKRWFLDYLFIVQRDSMSSKDVKIDADWHRCPENFWIKPQEFKALEVASPMNEREADFEAIVAGLTNQASKDKAGDWHFPALYKDNRFSDVKFVAQGGAAVLATAVYPAVESAERFALKLPRADRMSNREKSVKGEVRFLGEARMLFALCKLSANTGRKKVERLIDISDVEGPNVKEEMEDDEKLARFRHHLEAGRLILIRMKYYPNGSLAKMLPDQATDTPGYDEMLRRLKILHTLAHTIQQLHRAEHVHRDLKPANVLLDDHLQPILADLGIAAREQDIGADNEGGMGTLYYRAPEQWPESVYKVSARTDIWAFGIMLYLAITGKLPFDYDRRKVGQQEFNDRMRHLICDPEHSPPPFSQYADGIRDFEALEAVVKGCMEKDPERRYKSFSEVLRDLGAWLQKQGVENLSGPCKFAWHPMLYQSYAKRPLGFILLKLSIVHETSHKRISEILEQFGICTFRIYQIFGPHDFLVRTALTHVQLEELLAAVEKNKEEIRPIATAEELTVSKIRFHWHWGNAEDISAIAKVQYDAVQLWDIEKKLKEEFWEDDPSVEIAIQKKLVRAITERNEQVLFFIYITQQRDGVNRDDIMIRVQQVAEQLHAQHEEAQHEEAQQHLIEHAVTSSKPNLTISQPPQTVSLRYPAVSHPAVYQLRHDRMIGLLKGEAKEFHEVGKLVRLLNELLAVSGCVTRTCIVADDAPLIAGKEDLQAAILAMPMTLRAFQDWFPGIRQLLAKRDDPPDPSKTTRMMEAIGCVLPLIHRAPVKYVFAAQLFIGGLVCQFVARDDSVQPLVLLLLCDAAKSLTEVARICEKRRKKASSENLDSPTSIVKILHDSFQESDLDSAAIDFERLERNWMLLEASSHPFSQQQAEMAKPTFLTLVLDLHLEIWRIKSHLEASIFKNGDESPFEGTKLWRVS